MDKPLNLAAGITRGDTLTDQAESVLRDALMSGGFRPGETITIRALSRRLGVSVTPAKDAMARLIGERILEWGPRRSALVPALTLQSIDEIYAIRLALEPTAAAAAIDNIPEKGIAELKKINARLATAMEKEELQECPGQQSRFSLCHLRARRPADAAEDDRGAVAAAWALTQPALHGPSEAAGTKRGGHRFPRRDHRRPSKSETRRAAPAHCR